MIKAILPLLLLVLGCSTPADRVAKTATQPPPAQTPLAAAMARPPAAQQGVGAEPDPNEIRYWVSPKELTPENWHTVGCVYLLKPECRADQMRMMMAYYEKSEGKPYLHCITDNWLRVLPRRPVSRNGWLQIPTCEDAWQWGDLNADCRVDYEDLAIYASTFAL